MQAKAVNSLRDGPLQIRRVLLLRWVSLKAAEFKHYMDVFELTVKNVVGVVAMVETNLSHMMNTIGKAKPHLTFNATEDSEGFCAHSVSFSFHFPKSKSNVSHRHLHDHEKP